MAFAEIAVAVVAVVVVVVVVVVADAEVGATKLVVFGRTVDDAFTPIEDAFEVKLLLLLLALFAVVTVVVVVGDICNNIEV